MIDIVIDTNVIVSKLDHNDKWHKLTHSIEQIYLNNTNVNYIVLDICINEAINVLCKRLESKKRLVDIPHFIGKFRQESILDSIIGVSNFSQTDYLMILNKIEAYGGYLNYNDCLIINFMERNQLKYLFSYDTDFDSVDSVIRIHRPESVF